MKFVPYQGKIATAKRDDGTEQEIHVYVNSSDFPGFHMVTMAQKLIPETSKFYRREVRDAYGTFQIPGVFPSERVPINEEIWRKIGKSLGYKFVVRKKKVVL